MDWTEFERLLMSRLDMNAPGMKAGVDCWREDVQRGQRYRHGDVVHVFKSPELIEAMLAYYQADIEENAKIHVARIAHEKVEVARAAVQAALVDNDGYVRQTDDEVRFEQLCVRRISKAQWKRIHRDVVDASVELLRSSEAVPEFPAGFEPFRDDLAELIAGDTGEMRRLLLEVTSRPDLAPRATADTELPQAIRFLASLVAEVGVREKEKPREIGFNSRAA